VARIGNDAAHDAFDGFLVTFQGLYETRPIKQEKTSHALSVVRFE
jgi:hypothetical protein